MTSDRLPLEQFTYHVTHGLVPPRPPETASKGGWDWPKLHYMKSREARDTATEAGMWAIVDQNWTRQLAEWIENREVLEIMAGAGWLARALRDCGVRLRATDSMEWDKRHSKMKRVSPVEKMEAAEAVERYGREYDLLLVSWPPYSEEHITAAARLWGPDKPIVYIGEGPGGCNAPDSFWDNFEVDESAPDFDLLSWPGIHDYVFIGTFRDAIP